MKSHPLRPRLAVLHGERGSRGSLYEVLYLLFVPFVLIDVPQNSVDQHLVSLNVGMSHFACSLSTMS
jgi:hypothetical protein